MTLVNPSLDRYVPAIALDWDLEGPGRTWREVNATLCFIDISGFTNLSERLARKGRIGAEELTDVLNFVFGNMIEVANRLGGSLLKFGGDALLLLFIDVDHEIRAASAAVEMRRVLKEAESYQTSVGRLSLRMSVGIHSGLIHLFRASDIHEELLIGGPGATRTTAMEKIADAGEIVVSSETRQALPPDAVGNAKEDGWILRWRTPRSDPVTTAPSEPVDPDAVARWIPQLLREHLAAGRPESEHRIVSVAFIRISGLDAVLATAGTDEAASRMNETVSLIQRAASDGGVTFLASDINEDGAKVILLTGAPVAQDEDEDRLLRVLRQIADASTGLDLHIGVNQGHVFAGEIGTSYRSTYTIIGDTVNLAARLASAAPISSIYATAGILDHAGILFQTEAIEPFHVKGKADLIHAYSVGPETGERGVETAGEFPFAGRLSELNQISRVVWDTLDGIGSVLTVLGDAGSGKSRLIREACLVCSTVVTISVRSESYGSSTPYRPVRDAFRSLLDVGRADQATMAANLAERVGLIDPDLLDYLPFIGDITHVEVPSTLTVDAIEPRFRPDRLADTAIALLEKLLVRPTVIDLDDAQWMDDATAHLMGRIADATNSHAWTVLVSRRGEDGGFMPSNGERIHLEGLGPDEAEALVIDATAGAPLLPHEVAAIVARAEGNPLFLHEIVQVVRDTGRVQDLPDSLGSVVSRSIDALPPLTRTILRYCSVLGRSFRTSIAQEVLLEENLELDGATRSSLRRFLVADGTDRLRFANAMIRDVAYDGLSFRRRREIHLRAAKVFERSVDDPDELADLLSLHYSIGGDPERAWHYARLAGDRARDAFANVDAATHYTRALDSALRLDKISNLDRAAVWTRLGEVREQAGLFETALDAYRRAYRLHDDPVARAELMLKRAGARERAAQYAMALRDTTHAKRLLVDEASAEAQTLSARAQAFYSLIRMRQGLPGEALWTAQVAVDEATTAHSNAALARAYGVMAWARMMMDEPGAERLWLDALTLYEQVGDLVGQGYMTNNLGGLAYFEGRWDEALEYYERSRDLAERLGNAVDIGVAEGNVGEVLVKQHKFDEAEPKLRRAVRVARASGDAFTVVFANLQLARIFIERGSYPEAQELLDRSRDEAVTLAMKGPAYEAAIYLADLKARWGEPEYALDLLERAKRGAGDKASIFAPTADRVRAFALASIGRNSEAVKVAGAALDAARARGLDYEVAMLLLCQADLIEEGDAQAATQLRVEGNAIVNRLDIRPPEAV